MNAELIGSGVIVISALAGLYFLFKNNSDNEKANFVDKESLSEIKKDMATKSDMALLTEQILSSNTLMQQSLDHLTTNMEQSLVREREARISMGNEMSKLREDVTALNITMRDYSNIIARYEEHTKLYKDRTHGQ